MVHRMKRFATFVGATMLAACSQGQNTPTAAPESPVYGTTTGALACDEYLSLAKGCIDKGRFGAVAQRRAEFDVVERTLRESVSGAAFSIDRDAVWASAVRTTTLEQPRAQRVHGAVEKRDALNSAVAAVDVCKRAIDQLPSECQ